VEARGRLSWHFSTENGNILEDCAIRWLVQETQMSEGDVRVSAVRHTFFEKENATSPCTCNSHIPQT
jgi:hypothetical protein